ncbi:hypothetical protein [Arcobacter peruensis]|uniref:hypothetical protein n=1 Tax=Arcobacter peruensis TaxID=2320140 RepID=UPI000F0758F9|nr:hypothetical protein [Arcobacter peruensis]
MENKIKITKVSNAEGSLNKTFSLDQNGQVKKQSNAFLSNGTAEVIEINDLTELYHLLENLKSNEAIILGEVNDESI